MASSFCPKCGTPRVGAFQFCRSCKFDFDDIDRAAGAGSAPPPPESSLPPQQSYSEKYAGTPWVVTPVTPSTSAEQDDRRSPRGVIAILGIVSVGAVLGLVLILATGGLGLSPAAPAATTSGMTSATEQPRASPTAAPATPALPATPLPTSRPSPTPSRDAAATRYMVIENAYIDALNAHQARTHGTSQHFSSYAQARSYYRSEVRNLQRFETKLRAMTFPADIMPGVRVLLRRISELEILMEDLAGRESASYGWKLNEQILKAYSVMDAARIVVGKDLGLTYGDATGG